MTGSGSARNSEINRRVGDHYVGKKVLVTGGAGFIGSNIAKALHQLGAHIIVYDSFAPLYGGNKYNLRGIEGDRLTLIQDDVRNGARMDSIIPGVDLVYHLAAQVSYLDSGRIPFEDYDITARSTLEILECIRRTGKKTKIVFASSRMVLGMARTDLITEDHPTDPLTIYGVHKLTSEKYLQIYYRDHSIPSTILRITNPYGPGQQVKHGKYSLVGWFIRLAMEGGRIKVFGQGTQKRDYIYIDDIVNAFVLAGALQVADGKIYNLGTGISTEFRHMAQTVVDVVKSGSLEYISWPSDYEHIETGDLNVDVSRLKKDLGWQPRTDLRSGIQLTYEFLREHLSHYIS
jgi:UDP-glucose 4-epimerase